MFISGLSGRFKTPFRSAPPLRAPAKTPYYPAPPLSRGRAKMPFHGLNGWGSKFREAVRSIAPPFIPQPPMPGATKPKDILKASKVAVKKTTAVVKKVKAPILKATKKTVEVHKKVHAPLVKITKEVSKPAVQIYRKTAMPVLKKAAPILSKIAPLLAFIPVVGWVVYAVYAAQAYQVLQALKASRAAKKANGAADAEIAALDAQIAANEQKIRELDNAKKSDDPNDAPPGAVRDAAIAQKAKDDAAVADGTAVRENKNPLGILAAIGGIAMFLF